NAPLSRADQLLKPSERPVPICPAPQRLRLRSTSSTSRTLSAAVKKHMRPTDDLSRVDDAIRTDLRDISAFLMRGMSRACSHLSWRLRHISSSPAIGVLHA